MIRVDTSHAPLVVVRWAGGITPSQVEQYIEVHDGLLESEVEHAVLVEVNEVSVQGPATAHLVRIADWLDYRAGELTRNCLACAIVVEDEALRGAIETFCEVRPLELPTRMFGRSTKAVDWMRPMFEPGPSAPATESSLGRESSSPESIHESGTWPPADGSEWSPYGDHDPAESTHP